MNIKKVLKEGGIGKARNGFTLVELLIVIGILALLASVVIIALNPLQNLAKTRDAGRLDTVAQLGHALESYATANAGNYVDTAKAPANVGGSGLTWINTLTGSGDITTVPADVKPSISGISECTAGGGSVTQGVQNGWCYLSSAGGVGPILVYTRAEASANIAKCPTPATDLAWLVYSSKDGKSGVVCTTAAQGEAGLATGSQTFR